MAGLAAEGTKFDAKQYDNKMDHITTEGQYFFTTFDEVCESFNAMGLHENLLRGIYAYEFKWDDVKVDKHRENYLGHSIKAPVGRWQKGKDLHWYAKDKKSQAADMEAAKAEIQRIKEEEEQAMREALGLAPKRSNRPQGNRLDKHEFSELVKRGSTAEDLGAGHAEAAHVQGLGFARPPRSSYEESSSLPTGLKEEGVSPTLQQPLPQKTEDTSDDENNRKKRKREERKHEKRERKHEKHEKRRSHDSEDRRKHRRDKDKRRHDSD